jgi:hypothetical protein
LSAYAKKDRSFVGALSAWGHFSKLIAFRNERTKYPYIKYIGHEYSILSLPRSAGTVGQWILSEQWNSVPTSAINTCARFGALAHRQRRLWQQVEQGPKRPIRQNTFHEVAGGFRLLARNGGPFLAGKISAAAASEMS